MWDLLGPGLEPVSPALAGGFLATAPPGKPYSFLWLKNISLYGYTTFCLSIHRLMNIWVVLTCWVLWIVLLFNIYVQVFVWLNAHLLGIYLEVELLGHMVILYLTFWGTARLFLTLLHHFTILHSHQQYVVVPISPHPQQRLFSFFFFLIVILVGERWYLIVVLICSSLMTNDAEHLFMCLLAICLSLEKCLFKSFACFVELGLLLSFKSSLYILTPDPY